jgi:hypothetical protein
MVSRGNDLRRRGMAARHAAGDWDGNAMVLHATDTEENMILHMVLLVGIA